MPKVNQLFGCPKCENPIDAVEKPDTCPHCNFDLRIPGKSSGIIEPPVTIFEQAHRHQDDDRPVLSAVLKLELDKMKMMMLDAYYVVKTLPVKKATEDDIREVLGYAISIGEMAKGYKSFLDAGGRHTPELVIPKKGGHNGENNAT